MMITDIIEAMKILAVTLRFTTRMLWLRARICFAVQWWWSWRYAEDYMSMKIMMTVMSKRRRNMVEVPWDLQWRSFVALFTYLAVPSLFNNTMILTMLMMTIWCQTYRNIYTNSSPTHKGIKSLRESHRQAYTHRGTHGLTEAQWHTQRHRKA